MKGMIFVKQIGLPEKQGLYDPMFEHDSCGIGFIANIKGKKSHDIITSAIGILKKLSHRGGVGSEPDTGDGAGILIQIPHNFFKKVCVNEDIKLPNEGDYGVGMLFLSPDEQTRFKSIKKLIKIIEEEGQHYLGIREVPTYVKCIGKSAVDAMPRIMQVFIKKADNIEAGIAFERKLFIILKRAEKEIRACADADPYFYFTSLSSRTIVYKGMLTPDQVASFYLDLMDLDMTTSIALVHSRFSTNTFPSWERAHPNRYIIHNGEINTIRGNVNWTKAREKMFESEAFGDDLKRIYPIINEDGSDSAMLDNYLHMLTLSGYSLPEAVMMTIPEPWENDTTMDENKRAFYEYNSCTGEPWDGPAAIAFTDGVLVGATLDRNGLRPARYYVTKDDMVILSSEVGVSGVEVEKIIKKERLHPGKMLLIDTKSGRIIEDEEIKDKISKSNPYGQWLKENLINIDETEYDEGSISDWAQLVDGIKKQAQKQPFGELIVKRFLELENLFVNRENDFNSKLPLLTEQKAFGYTWEDIDATLKGIVEKGEDPISAMGTDIPLAVLSEKPQLLYNYFKQLFAQVTNPPIDAIREEIVTSSLVYLGGEKNLLKHNPENCRRIRSKTPILSNTQISRLRGIKSKGFKTVTIPILYNKNTPDDMIQAIKDIYNAADIAVDNGYNLIILSDKGVNENKAAIPALLACAGLHHHLIEKGTRMNVSIILESGEPREVHHFAVLLGYGVNAINPYLVYKTLEDMSEKGYISKEKDEAVKTYIDAVTHGIVKIMSKMGISTIQSYQGAQIFEALGISESVVNEFFTGTATRIGGLDINHIEKEARLRHDKAFEPLTISDALDPGGEYKWRRNGEYHMFNPETIHKLQTACRTGDYKLFKEYTNIMNNEEHLCTIRSLLDIRTIDKPINIDTV